MGTIGSPTLSNKIKNWRTNRFEILDRKRRISNTNQYINRGWKLTPNAYKRFCEGSSDESHYFGKQSTVEKLPKNVKRECDMYFTRKRIQKIAGQLVYWWTPTTAEKKKICVMKRCMTKANRTEVNDMEIEEIRNTYKSAKHELKKAIEKQNREMWRQLCEDLDRDVWGKAMRAISLK